MADTWRKITYVKLSCSTATHRQGRMGYPQPRSYMATQYRTCFLLTDVHFIWQSKTGQAEQSAQASQDAAVKYYNSSAHNLPDIIVGSHVAVQHPMTKLWDTYGVVTSIGPHRQYYVKTHKGQILVHNRRFLHRRVPTSIPAGRSEDPQPPPPRRSMRTRKPVNRLIEDPSWT